ncbi:MAG: hypothetical protein MUC63_06010, partial [Planctomycetes bacterium]|nr:hypothetical protein [Planctomycetota bacterium]
MLITDLAQLKWLKVYSRDRVQTEMGKLGLKTGEEAGAGAKIAKALSADILLHGTFVGVGKDVKITIQVLSYPTEDVILSDQALGPLDGLLGMIDDLTRRIRRGLAAQFRPGEGTQDMVENLAALRDRLVEVSAARAELEDGRSGAPGGGPEEAFENLLDMLQDRLEAKDKAPPSASKEGFGGPRLAGGDRGAADSIPGEAKGGEEESGVGSPQQESLERLRKSEKKLAEQSREPESDRKAGKPAAPAGRPAGGPAPKPAGDAPASPAPPAEPAEAPAAEGKLDDAEGGSAAEGNALKDQEEQAEGQDGAEPRKDDKPAPGARRRLEERAKANVGLLAIEVQVDAPKDPLTRAMMLVYRARDLRETRGDDPASLRTAVSLLREALKAQPNLSIAKAEMEALKARIQGMAKKD